MNNDLTPYEGQIIESIPRPKDVPEAVPPEDWTMVSEWIRSKRSAHTKKAYKREINLFYLFVTKKRHPNPDASLQSLTLSELQDYAEKLAKEHPEPATQAQMLAAIKSLLTFGQRMGYLQYNIGTAQQLPQGKDKLAERILEPSEVHGMIYEAQKSGNKRDYTLLLVLYGGGIRCSELCNLQWKDVQSSQDGGQITVLGKRNKTRSILLHPKAWKALQIYKPAHAKPNDYVFPSRQTTMRNDNPSRRLTEARVWQIVSGIAKKAGLEDKKVSPHWLRHTHATIALTGNNKAPIKLLQETLGHTSLAVTGKYTHARPEDSSSMYLDL